MKRIIFFVLILIVSAQSFGQKIRESPNNTREFYLKKSKTQKVVGWTLIGSGTTLVTIGLIKFRKDFDLFGSNQQGNQDVILGCVGLGMIGGGIVFISAANYNHKKSIKATATFKMETVPIIQRNTFVQTSFPALSVKINFIYLNN